MTQHTILSLVEFTEAQLNKLRAVSPAIEVQQITDAAVDDVPESLRERVEILYGVGEPLFEAHRYPQLKWIQAHSAGINMLLDKPIWQSPVLLTTANGVHPTPMAEYALALMLAFRWNVPVMFKLSARQNWPSDRWQMFSGPELRGSTLGIVGYGAVGRELARLAHALGMRVLAVNRSGRRTPYRGYSQAGLGDPAASLPERIYATAQLAEMLPQCDHVVVLAPYTEETHHLFRAETLAHLKPTAFFYNLARGGLVDEAALVEALRQGQIAGAGLDVFEQEPLPPDSPLWHLDNVIMSPHISGFTPHYDDRASDLFAENLRRYLNGDPLLNLVERERGY